MGEEFETEHAPTRLRRAASLVGGVALILTITHYAEVGMNRDEVLRKDLAA